eukprot:m.408953 g.408953  ORF g.408953 m.408953 type:complete len:519 (-) comp21238_c0_seq30:206-1762(-)
MHRASDMGMKKAHPKLSDEKLSSGQFNTSVLVSFCLLLFWTGASGVVIAASSLFLQQACGDVGLDPAISNRNGSDGGCFDNKSNSTQHDLYTRAQSGAATSLFAFTVVTGIASLLSCPAFGALADAQGRKVALCITLLCACLSNLTVAVLQVRTYMLIAVGAFNFGGGPYAVVGTAFSVIADVSPTLPVKIRAKIFGRVEACLWFGLLIGPVATGAIVDRFGSRHAFVFLAIPPFVAACLILTCFAETLEQRRPICWARCNPLGSLHIFTTNRAAMKMALVVLPACIAIVGHSVIMPLYCYDVYTWTAQKAGVLQTIEFGSNALGLLVVLPTLARVMPAKWIIIIANFAGLITYSAEGLVSSETLFFVCAGSVLLNGLYFPIVRAAVSKLFGPQKYGESLGAVATLQQLAQTIAAIAFPRMYSSLLHVNANIPEIVTDDFGPRLVFGLIPGGCAALAFIASCTLPTIETIQCVDDSSDSEDVAAHGDVDSAVSSTLGGNIQEQRPLLSSKFSFTGEDA